MSKKYFIQKSRVPVNEADSFDARTDICYSIVEYTESTESVVATVYTRSMAESIVEGLNNK